MNDNKTHLPDPRVSFTASLSNGEIIVENKGDWCWVDGLKSPWQRLIRYAVEKKLAITSLSLITPNGQILTLPPIGKAHFVAYVGIPEADRPLDFEVKRYLAREMSANGAKGTVEIESVAIKEFYTIAEAIYKDFTLQLWVNELNPANSWTVYKKGGE